MGQQNGKAKGQSSTEILTLIGMFLIVLVPLLLYAYSRASITSDDLAVQKAEFAASRLASAADAVGYLGGSAAIVEEVEVPPSVRSISINGKDIVFELDVPGGKKQIVKGSSFALKSEGLEKIRQPGTYYIEVYSISNYSSAFAEKVGMKLR